ncbi:MAG: site-specific integrase [Kiritimatiellia bacterium]|jgi:integrase|nr:site-specific integrase [Kiritimatiellia bacterium]
MSKSYQQQWSHKGSIIRRRGSKYQVETNYNNKRERKSFDTLAKAKTHASQKATEIRNLGLAAFALSNREREDAVEALKLLKGETPLEEAPRTPLAEAARFWMQHNRPAGGTKKLKDLVDEYVTSKIKANRRPETIKELRNKLGNFAESFPDREVHTITVSDLENWLDTYTTSASYRNKHRNLFHGLFGYARKRNLIEQNPAADIEMSKADERMPEAYSVDDTQKILNAAANHYEKYLPALAIGFFSGLRPAEVEGLDWSSVNFQQKHIVVTPETAKRRRRRLVAMHDNLVAWLKPYKRDKGPVVPNPRGFDQTRRKILAKAGLGRWIYDGSRHTYGTMHLPPSPELPPSFG